MLPQVFDIVETLSARNSRFAVSVVAATPLSGFAAGVPFALLADVPLAAVGGIVASFAGFAAAAPATGWSDCGMVLLLVFMAVSLLEYVPCARTRSPTWSARLPENMLVAITGTVLSLLVRMANCPLPELSRQPTTLSFPEAVLLALCVVEVVIV